MILAPLLIALWLEGCLDGSRSAHTKPVETISQSGTDFPNLLQLYFQETVYGPVPDWYQYFAAPESEKSDQLRSVMGKVYFLMESELKTRKINRRRTSHTSVLKLLAGLRLLVQAQTVASSEMRAKLKQNAQAMFTDIEISKNESAHRFIVVGTMRAMCESSNTVPSIETYCRKRAVEGLIAWYMLLQLCIDRPPPGTLPNEPGHAESCKRTLDEFEMLRLSGFPVQNDEFNSLVLNVYRNYMEAVDLVLYKAPSDQRDQRILELVATLSLLPHVLAWETYSPSARKRLVLALNP